MTEIVSSTPGRMRLRHANLRDADFLERLQQAVARWRHVLEAKGNARSGSLVVCYDGEKLGEKALAGRLDREIGRLLALASARQTIKHGKPSRVVVNRWAKRGMLASLGVSLLLAGAGQKRWHALSGGAFVAALAVHLWVHRRHIFK